MGLCWAGSPQQADNASRSLPITRLHDLMTVSDVDFVSLQLGDQLTGLPQYACRDWLSTANNMMALDLIITVDTSIVHMAGALGRPTWLLNRYNLDWRWLLNDEAIGRWYPTVRIFRQPRLGDWDIVVRDVRKELMLRRF